LIQLPVEEVAGVFAESRYASSRDDLWRKF